MVLWVWAHSEPRTGLLVQFSPNPKPWTKPQSGLGRFRFRLQFRTKLQQHYIIKKVCARNAQKGPSNALLALDFYRGPSIRRATGNRIPLGLRFMDIYRSWTRYALTCLNTLNFPSQPCMSRVACITCNRLFLRLFLLGFIYPTSSQTTSIFIVTKYLLQLN